MYSNSPINVLLIEDNPDDARLIHQMASDTPPVGYQLLIHHVPCLEDGLNHLLDNGVDVVLLDLALPDSYGIETLVQLHSRSPDVPAVILSGMFSEQIISQAVELGAQDFLVKGEMDGRLLSRVIRHAIERHHFVQQLHEKSLQLQQSESRLRNIIDKNSDGILVVDEDGLICFANPAAEALLGRSTEDLLHTGFGYPVAANEVAEIEIRRRNGDVIFTEMREVDINWAGRLAYLVSLHDITTRKNLQKQLIQSQKMEALGLLTGGIAHDFNNVLTAINGFAELLQYKLKRDDPLYDMADKILNAGQKAAELIRQLLIFSRKQPTETGVVCPRDVILSMGSMLRRIIGEDVFMETILEPGLWPVMADKTQMEQIIINLAVNARDAMPGGGKLTIAARNVTIDTDEASRRPDVQPGEYILLSVADTGVGMSEEVKARIYDPFFTTKEEGKGTGLGLSTVYGIVRQSGGHIEVDSQPGNGATFFLYLPRAAPLETQTQETPVEKITTPAGNETILLVEDDEPVREVTKMALQGQNYQLLEASNGREALKIAASYQGPIHLLLTDLVMPGMNGIALSQHMQKIYPGIKTMYVSGYGADVVVPLYPNQGTTFLQKPFSSSDLLRKVRAVLDTEVGEKN